MSTAFANETLIFGIAEQELVDGGGREWLSMVKQDWKMLFFHRARFAEAYEEKEKQLKRIEELDRMSFADAQKEARAINAAASSSSNYLMQFSNPDVARTLVAYREVIAKLRLVRAAAGFLANGEVPALDDPFGDKLLFKEENGKTKIWSLGRDGKSQNGKGTWEDGTPDMVIEVPVPKRRGVCLSGGGFRSG